MSASRRQSTHSEPKLARPEIPHPLTAPRPPSTDVYLLYVVLASAVGAWACLLHPSFLRSSAYGWVFDLSGGETWPVGFCFAAVVFLILGGVHQRSVTLLAFGLALSMFVQFTFGLSVFLLTLDGTVSAITGTMQWWTIAWVNGWLLWRQAK